MTAATERREPPATARALVVGAGGIGCELLKCMVLHGFRNIHVVDLDTIELSNLNRQFLFRRQHIGQPKAEIAAKVVEAMAPRVNITAHRANIKDTQTFPLSFFSSFDLVLNALDNLDARRYVNNICQTVRVPLVESGTAGYLGQCTVILPGESECFDCTPKEQPKTFPVCTIRTMPTSIIHCIVWAKEFLLTNLFDEAAEEQSYPEDIDPDLLASLKMETEAFDELRRMARSGEQSYARTVVHKVFYQDIQKLCSLPDLWEHKQPPTPLDVDLNGDPAGDSPVTRGDDHHLWTVAEWLRIFRESIDSLRRRAFGSEGVAIVPVYFDKDDESVMDFVAAAANLRASIFALPMSSRFNLKSMAGNIIPAIATTNAIVAGIMVLQAENVLLGHRDKCRTAFITYGGQRSSLFACECLSPPNRDCPVCHLDRVVARLDPSQVALRQLLEAVVQQYSGLLGAPLSLEDTTVVEGSRILYDEDLTTNLDKRLLDIGCGECSLLKLDFIPLTIPLLVAIDSVVPDPSHHQEAIQFTFTMLPPHLRDSPATTQDGDKDEEEDDIALEPPAKMSRISLEDDHDVVLL